MFKKEYPFFFTFHLISVVIEFSTRDKGTRINRSGESNKISTHHRLVSSSSAVNWTKSKMEQNEPDHHTPQVPVLCANNCGFFGSAATMNMCSKCYKDIILKQEPEKLAAVSSIRRIVDKGSNTDAKESDVTTIIKTNSPLAEIIVPNPQTPSASLAMEKNDEVKGGPKRCATCRKRVGLTGFNCRCGSIFCSVHRYYDKHECPFDYRAAGQEAISQANPVIKAEKLDKI